MKFHRTVLAALLMAVWSVGAHAQSLPKPKEFYFDPDAAAAPIVVYPGEGDALAAKLLRERERGRRAVEATAQLARIAMESERVELGTSLYQQALSSSQATSSAGRSVRWNYGWDLYRQGQFEQALSAWNQTITGFGAPSWMPPTFALGLWKAGRRGEAVEWYAAAVRTEPRLWNDPANYPALLPEWRQEDRAALAEVLQAWQANPPRWP